MKKRAFNLGLLALSLSLACGAATAQTWPDKPLRWVVGYPAGGGSDIVARIIADGLRQVVGQPVVVDNRPGASTAIAAQAVAKSAPDGYTLFSPDNGTMINNPVLFRSLPYDPVADFAPVTMIGRFPLLVVANPQFPASDIRAFIELVKKNPGKFSYASPGKGTPHHLAMELLKSRAGLDVPDVSYRGGAPATQDVLANQVPFMVLDASAAAPHLRAGKLKALAVISGERLGSLPDVPAIAEAGYQDLDVSAWQGVVVPAKTPRAVIDQLNAALVKAIALPETQSRLRETGMLPTSSTPEQYAARLKSEAAFWQPFIRTLGIQLD